MLLALVGSHGTGKTTVFDEVKRRYPQYQFFSEVVRQQMFAFGYNNPYEIVDELGIGAFELMNINAWSIIDPSVNTIINTKQHIITDRSAVDSYAYYVALRRTETDFASARLIKAMARYYASLVDLFVYFPIVGIPLIKDAMRKDDKQYQKDIDIAILASFTELGVSSSKIHRLENVGIVSRVEEVLNLLK